MKTAKRRVLSFLMALFVMVTTVCGHVDYTVAAEETTSYTKVSLASDITSGGKMVFVAKMGETYYALGTSIAKKITPNEVSVSAEGIVTGDVLPVWTVAPCDTGISLYNGSAYLGYGTSGTDLQSKTEAYVWNVAESGDGFRITSAEFPKRAIAYRASTYNYFKAFDASSNASNTTEYAFDILVFKLAGSTGVPEGSDTTAPSENTTETPAEPIVATIADAVKGTNGTLYTVTGVVTAVDDKNLYIQDTTGGICIRMSNAPTDVELGDVVTGTGSKAEFNGLPQLENASYSIVENSELTLVAKKTTVDALTSADICTYVEIDGLRVTEVYDNNGAYNNPNITVTDGTNSIQIYKAAVNKTDGKWDISVDDVISVKAAVGINKGKLQLRNTLSSEITVTEKAPVCQTIAEALAATEGIFTVKGVVTHVEGQNVYVQDATGGICLYFDEAQSAIKLGDTIIGTGTRTAFNDLPELAGASYRASSGLKLAAKATTIGELTEADVCEYVEITNVKVTEVYDNNGGWSAPNITVTDGTNSIQLYKAVVEKTEGTWSIKVGDVLDIKAAVGINKGKLQLRNTLVSEVTVKAAGGTDNPTNPENPSNPSEVLVADGTYVIYNPANKKLLSSVKSGNYNIGVDKTIEDVTATVKVDATELWTVTNNSDGTVTITCSEGVLSMGTQYSSLQYNDVNDKWTLGKNSDGTFYVKNVGRNSYIEWYAENNYWSAYGTIGNNADLFKLQFVKATDGIGKVTSAADLTTGTYVMVTKDGYAPYAVSGNWVSLAETNPTIVGDKVTDAKGAVWTLTVSEDGVIFTDSTFTSFAPVDGENKVQAGTYKWKVVFNNDTQTFRFQTQDGAKTLARNKTSGVRVYANTTVGNSGYYPDFTLYKVEKPKAAEPTDGSKVVIYNVAAEGVLATQDDNLESPSINSTKATIGTDGKVTAENGGVVFEVQKNGEFFRFYNTAYGYLCSKDEGNNAYYTLEACDEADWTLEHLDSGFKLKNKVAKYSGTGAQYLEYYSDSYKTYSFYGTNKDGTPADTSIYEFRFLECANTNLTEDVVNAPAAVVEAILNANKGSEYTFTFEVDAPFGVKEVAVAVNGEAIDYTEAAGMYKIVVPAEKVIGDKLTIVVSGKDNKDVAITGTFEVTVKDEPVVANMTPSANSETGNNKKPVISADIINAGDDATVTMLINDQAVEATYANGKVTYTSATDMVDGRYSVTVTVTRADGKTVTKTWAFTVGKADFQLYFGQLHSHTTFSDGSGTLDSALDYIANLPESANVDFVAFTDHSNYFDESSKANPAEALYDMSKATATSQEKWKEYKDTIAAFNDKKLGVVALGGFEMTWSGGPGHINTFNTPGIVSRNNKTLNDKTKDAGMKAYYALLNQAEGVDSLSQFNHPGSTFGTFSDFAYWDAVLDTRIQLVEVGNGEGSIGSGGYFPSYEYYTMALDKGWHLAPTNNQDNHKGKWGNANDARDVILTDDFSEEGIYKAIREMRMYATEDKNLEIYYTLNGLQLGSTISEVPEKVTINVNVYDPDATDKISKVEVIVNSGKVAHTWDDAAEIAKGELACELDAKYSYYYIRVTQDDGDLAVTAPVWVGETLKLGISSVECGTSYPVTDEEAVITTRIFNSENESAYVKSLTYTINGSEVVNVDTTRYNVAALSTTDIEFKYTPTVAKLTKLTVTAVVSHDNEDYTFTMDLTLDVQDASKLIYLGIDAAHYNEYVAGNYKDSMGNFSELAGEYSIRTVELATSEELIAACSNSKYRALILTAPSRRDKASWTDPRTYSDAEIAAIKAFNENGGIVIFSGWSDHYENPEKTENNTGLPFEHMAATQNKVLEALGSSIRISDDATYDDVRSAADKVDAWRLYFNTYGDNYLTEGVIVDEENPYNRYNTEVFSHYGGASIYVVDANGNATTTLPATVSPVVFGHSTTYSVDADNDNLGGDKTPKYAYKDGDNRLMVMALEQLEGRGEIIVSGAAFMSNFEVQAELDNTLEKNYSNYRICENLVSKINPITITPIAEVQAQKEVGYKYTIEGIVTTNASGYDKDTAFFDCIYVQDATGGVCCFPVAGNYKIGDKVRVTGTTEFYQGEMELQVSSIEVIGSGTVTSKSVTAAQINDLSVLGQLVTLTGKVVSFEMANGLVQTIMVQDTAGNVARVFIDGYITTGKDVQNLAVGRTITVTGISSFDDTFNAPNGPFPRIRVKDRSDVICTAGSTGGSTGGSSSSGSGSYTPEEETTEAPSTEAPTTKPGTTTQKPSTEENTTTTPSTEPVEVIIPVNGSVAEQTEAIVEAIEEAKAGNDVVIKVEDTESGEVAVSVEVFKTLEENKKVDLVVELANGFTWTIDASTVDTSKVEAGLEAINLWVEIVEEVIPAEIVKETAGENKDVREISLKHNGEFGFTAALDVPLGKEFAGRNATLYYFNPEAKALEAQELVTIDEFGKARFTFTHASDYVVVIEEAAVEAPVDTEVNTEAPVDTEGQAEGNATPEEKGGSPVIVIILVLLAVAAGCFAFAYSKKKK